MRRPHLSTGAWLFSGIVAAALITPAGVYAAVNSRVAIGNAGASSVTATVTQQHQLLTTSVAPRDIVRISPPTNPTSDCRELWVPPVGKALVLLSATVEIDRYGTGPRVYVTLNDGSTDLGCTNLYDSWDTDQAGFAEQHTYPAGLPLSGLWMARGGAINASAFVTATGYLIPLSQLPCCPGRSFHTPKPKR